MNTLSWKPKRRGDIYCAPACGRGCTWAEFQQAKAKCNALRKLMRNPKEWRVFIWENLGWHYSLEHIASRGLLTVVPYDRRNNKSAYYYAMFSDSTPHAGNSEWTDDFMSRDPNKAVSHVISLAAKTLRRINQVIHLVKS